MSQAIIQSSSSKHLGFFARQFAVQRTKYQDRFDVLFGVVLPVLCFEFDPIVFKAGFTGHAMADEYQLVTYAISGVEITAMVVWLTYRDRLTSFSGPIAGVLFLGGVISTLIGVLLLPLSLIGLVIIIGVAGFTPFVTGLVYLRNGVRAFRSHENNPAYNSRISVGVATAMIALALPIFAAGRMSAAITNSVSTILESDTAQVEISANKLRRMRLIPETEQQRLVSGYAQETDPAKKLLIKRVYEDLTGKTMLELSQYID